MLEEKRIKYQNFLASITKSPADIKAKEIYFTKVVNKNSLSIINEPHTRYEGNMVGKKDSNGNNVYCSHKLKLEKDQICPKSPDIYSTNPIDARIFNVPGGHQFQDNMTCPVGYGEIVSCLKPRMSPDNKGEMEPNSTETWCINSKGDHKGLIPYKQIELSEDVCIPNVEPCGYGTSASKLPIKVSFQSILC